MVYNVTIEYTEVMTLVAPNDCFECNLGPINLSDAIYQAELWLDKFSFETLYILNAYTGEVLATFASEDAEIPEDAFDEVGFDAYMGCYSYEC